LKKLKILMIVLGVLLASLSVFSGCNETDTPNVKVVTTTSLLEEIVERVSGDKVEVVNIIPPSQCPGHFDVKPGDIKKLSDAALFLMHGWQGEMFTGELIASADNPDLVTVIVNAKVGENINWLSPPVQKVAVDNVVAALVQVDSGNKAAYEEAAVKYKSEIDAKAAKIQDRIAGKDFSGIKVMCNEQLTGLVKWMGLNIVSTYGRPEDLTPQVVKDLIDTARAENVTLFIDNLQSGAEAAAQMVEELGCKRVTFTNFPGGYDDTETWEKAIDYDIDVVLEAIGK
jgi:zinc transport system substrate-binding protein